VAVTEFFLNNFMAEFRNGSRPNQFFCDLVVPSALKGAITDATRAEQKMRFMCKGASLPASTIGVIPVPFRGRTFKVAGDREFQEWTVMVTNDSDQLIRNVFEEWMDWIVGNVNHDQFGDSMNPLDYMASGDVHQLNKNGDKLKSYKFVGIWPSAVGEIQLGFDLNDQVEEFPVTFQVQWWESDTTRNNTGADKFARTGGGGSII